MSPGNDTMLLQWIEENKPPAALFLYLHRTIEQHFAQLLAPYNIGWDQYAILMALYEKDGRSGDDIARQRGFGKAAVAGAVTVLKKEGLVKGNPDPETGTLKLTLTDKGRKIEPEMKKIVAAMTAALLKGFDADGLAQAMAALKKIAVNASRL